MGLKVSLKNVESNSLTPPDSLLISFFLFQESGMGGVGGGGGGGVGGGGGMRGSPLAMLAAQCNKLTNKSPPPLADAAVGKGFHPWKKCSGQSLTSGSPEETRTNSQPSSPAQSTYSHNTSPAPQYGNYILKT